MRHSFWLFQNRRRQQPRRKRLLALRLLLVQQSCFPYLSVVGLKQAAVTRRSAISMQINRRRPARARHCADDDVVSHFFIAYTHPIHRKKRTHWHCSLADTLKKLSSTKTKEKQQTAAKEFLLSAVWMSQIRRNPAALTSLNKTT